MSKLELLNPKETAIAAAMGWSVRHVYDLRSARWLVLVMPAVLGSAPLPTAESAGIFVINLARQGNALAVKAMRLVMASHAPYKPRPKPRKKS